MKKNKIISSLCLIIGLSCIYPVNGYANNNLNKIVPIKPLTFKDKLKLTKDPQVSFVLRNQKLGPFLEILAQKAELNLVNILPKEKTNSIMPNITIKNMPLSEVIDLTFTMNGLVAKRIGTNLIVGTREELPSLAVKDDTVVRYFPIINDDAKKVFDKLKKILPLMNISVKEPQKIQEEVDKTGSKVTSQETSSNQTQQANLIAKTDQTNPFNNQMLSALTELNKENKTITTNKQNVSTVKLAGLIEVDLATIDIDERMNSLIVIGSPEVIDVIESLLPSLDRPLPQVMTEIKIIGLSSSGSKKLGFEYGIAEKKVGIGLLGNAGVPGGVQDGIPLTPPGGTTISFNALGDFTAHLNAKIEALVINGEAKIISNTRVASQLNKEAVLSVTDQIPVVTTTTTMTTSTQNITWAPIGEQLSIKPLSIDTENGWITLDLKPKISNKGKELTVNGNPVYETQERSVSTVMRVRDGESIVIGGLKRKSTSNSQSKVPVLGDLPVIGNLFTNNAESEDETEVIIIVTPRITTESINK